MSESPGHRPRTLTPTAYLLMMTFRAWLIEVPVAAFNAFVLMDLVYAPRFGTLVAHQIGMFTRIAIILLFAYLIAYFAGEYTGRSLLLAGLFWVALWLLFEWGGSLLIGRSVHEILIGWHVERGYMWPYVLLAYLLAPLLVGSVLHPARPAKGTPPTTGEQDHPRRPTSGRAHAGDRILLVFLAVAFGFTWLFWIPDGLGKRGLLPDSLWTNLGFIGAWGPLVAAITAVAMESRWAGLRQFLKSSLSVRFAARWWIVSLLLFPAIIIVAQFASIGGGATRPAEGAGGWAMLPLVFIAVLFTGGPLQEEFGWRGYALPRLQQRWTPLVASLVLGLIWAVWHLPQFLVPPERTGMFYVTPIWTFVITVTAASVVFGWVGNHTGGSVIPALLLHTTMNLGFWLSPVLYTATGPYWVMVLLVFAVAAIALLDRQTMLRTAPGVPGVPSR